MIVYLVYFYWEGDNNPVYDSVWTDEADARKRVDQIDDLEADIDSIDWEPIAFNEAGYEDEELTD